MPSSAKRTSKAAMVGITAAKAGDYRAGLDADMAGGLSLVVSWFDFMGVPFGCFR